MRSLLICALCVLATAAAAQGSSFNTSTINGVRVWSPKPAPELVVVPAPVPPQQTTIIVQQSLPPEPEPPAVIVPQPVYVPRPGYRPRPPHNR